MFEHATTDIIFLITKNVHILQPTLSMGHRVIVRAGGGGGGEEEGVKWPIHYSNWT